MGSDSGWGPRVFKHMGVGSVADEQKPEGVSAQRTPGAPGTPFAPESSGPSGTPRTPGAAPPVIDKETLRKLTAGFNPGDIIVGRYEVQKMLGRGGMGMVYLVWDRELQQPMALKTLLPQYLSSSHAVKRFVREVNAVRQLDHPCIVKVFDANQVGSILYYTMEYVDGVSLYKWMKKKGKLGLGSVVRILSLLCHALEHAHQYTIHRDLSPDNVMVLQNGGIKLLDFGLAKLTNAQSAFTMIGVSLGKQQYMAPEQRASAAEVDKRADVYSLGVMFYELLSGQLPKPGVKLTSLVPELHAEADAFVEKAMAREPDLRFQDAREFRHALAHLYKLSTGVAIPGSDAGLPEGTPIPITGGDHTPVPIISEAPSAGIGERILGMLRGAIRRFTRR